MDCPRCAYANTGANDSHLILRHNIACQDRPGEPTWPVVITGYCVISLS